MWRGAVSLGYTADDVDVLMSDDTRSKYYGTDKKIVETELGTKALEGAGVGAGVGAVADGALAAAATVLIPGVGLVVAGPIAAGLAGAGAGSVTGGLTEGDVPRRNDRTRPTSRGRWRAPPAGGLRPDPVA
jgi:hypothetical protein